MTYLTLQPWELPPGSIIPLFAPADFNIAATAFRFVELRPAQFFLFLSDGAENLILLNPRSGEPRSWSAEEMSELVSQFAANPDEWKSQSVRLARLFILEDSAICLHEGFLIAWLNAEFQGRTEFRLPEKRERSDDIRAELTLLLEDPATEAAFSLKWSRLDFDGRRDAVFFSTKARAQLHQLMRWILQNGAELWNGEPYWMWKCDEATSGQHTLRGSEGERPLGPEFPQLYRWSQLLDEHVLPLPDACFASQFLCTRGMHQIAKWVQVEEPTADERVDARLQLEAWIGRLGLSFSN